MPSDAADAIGAADAAAAPLAVAMSVAPGAAVAAAAPLADVAAAAADAAAAPLADAAAAAGAAAVAAPLADAPGAAAASGRIRLASLLFSSALLFPVSRHSGQYLGQGFVLAGKANNLWQCRHSLVIGSFGRIFALHSWQ